MGQYGVSTRRSSQYVKVGAATAALVGLFAAVTLTSPESGDDADYGAVCVDDHDVRVDDARCDGTGSSGGHWYYVRSGGSVPGVGTRVSGGSFVEPDGAQYSVTRGGVDPAGGEVARGGFGGHAGGEGGHGVGG